MQNLPLIFCAVDTADPARAFDLAAAMQSAGCGIKLGLEFFCANGPQAVAAIRDAFPDLAIFLDLKFNDIPNTVAGAVRSATALAPAYMTVHANGGADMMAAAREAAHDEAARRKITAPCLLAVTVLTSFSAETLKDTGIDRSVNDQVRGLATVALDKKRGQMDGLVCSPREAADMRVYFGTRPILMIPGVRPVGSDAGDQRRIMTPMDAMRSGANHLVIGRPITGAQDPGAAAAEIMGAIQAWDRRLVVRAESLPAHGA